VQVQARDELEATAAYQPEPAAAAAARRFVRETLRSWPLPGRDDRPDPDALIDDAVLLTSELVTNAVVHAGTSVHVTCRLSAEAVEIVVLDGRPAQLIPDTLHPPADPAECTSGRGLHLPAQLASAWGVTYAQAAKAVWFRIGLPGLGIGTAADAPGGAAALDGGAGLAGTDDVPAWARRSLSRVGYEELLSSTAEAARAAVAADVAYLLDAGEDGELRVRAVAGADPAGREPGAPPGGAVRALAGAALSLVTVPLVVDGRVTGVLAVAAAEPDWFGEQDAARLQDLADWSAPPLERARLGELERGRRDRAAFLAAAGEELSVSLDEAKIAAAGASRAIGHLASWCVVLAAGEGRALRLLHAAHGDPAARPALQWLLEHVDPPGGPAPELPFRSRAAGWRWQPELPDGMPSATAELAAEPAWCLPLDAADRNLGLLIIGGPGGHWPPWEARELAAGLARRIAVALDNAGRHASRRVSAAGQAPARLASARREPIRRPSARREPARREPARQESAGPPPGGR
jgi:anti-sigma regulatory factor (Ser/Thr protein kinase)/GAF domain-containing protein